MEALFICKNLITTKNKNQFTPFLNSKINSSLNFIDMAAILISSHHVVPNRIACTTTITDSHI